MRHLSLGPGNPLNILAIGAHADDIEIGAGATILRLLDEHPHSTIRWVVASASPDRAAEARSSAGAFSSAAKTVDVIVGDLPDGRLPAALAAVKDLLEPLKTLPLDVVIAPHVGDAHQDHRTVAEVVWQTFRHHLVVEYEIPKYDGDLGQPNLFVGIEDATLRRKIELLEAHYPSQRDRAWWGADTVLAIARLRGIEAATRYAEAFHSRKLVL
jgi:LmbE family N-acetylglucosaminyl deacetylase